MATIHRPRRGSIAYSPRVRAKKETPSIRAWPQTNEPKILGFAGYKAGMTHVIITDNNPNSLTYEIKISVPVTIIETPPMKVVAIRVYEDGVYGARPIAEAWSESLDKELFRKITAPKKHDTSNAIEKIEQLIDEGIVKKLRILVHTQPKIVTGVPKKKPEIMENGIGGTDIKSMFEYAKTLLGKSVNINDVFKNGDVVDVISITTGKGTQGPVKRWGIQLQKAKHSRQGSLRQVGNLGPWHPAHVSWRVPQLGQTGYHQRVEYNKWIMQIREDSEAVNPKSGFLHYGLVRNSYVIIKGSVPGPVKRLIRFRSAIRQKKQMYAPEITYISTESKQG